MLHVIFITFRTTPYGVLLLTAMMNLAKYGEYATSTTSITASTINRAGLSAHGGAAQGWTRVGSTRGSGRVGSGRGSDSRQIWRVGSGRNFLNALFLSVSRVK